MFHVKSSIKDYFGADKDTFLCVTGQLEGECYALGLGSVYTFGPTFRSENSNTTRHLSEFWMIEPEVAFADLEEVADLATDYIKFLISYSLEHAHKELEFLMAREDATVGKDHLETLKHVRDSKIARITYTEAVEILSKVDPKVKKFEYPTAWGNELQSEHERFLAEEHFKMPVIVTDYPKQFKAFYMKQNADGKTVRAMDILVPGIGEIIGGSQREDDLQKLQTRMSEMKMSEEPLWWYLDLRRFGSVPHAGFGLGFERALMYITGMSNIRDVIPFPRTPNNCDF
jgi:asparaginyl-tRNA synthetase